MSLKTLTKTLAAATLFAAATAAFAQGATTALPASPAKKELVAKLLQLQQPGIEGMARSMLQQPVSSLMQNAGAALQQLPAEKREATAKAIEAEVRKFVEETTPLLRDRAIKLAPTTVGTLLEERFTEDELRQLLAWLESPVNKKFSQLNGEMQSALGQKLVAETRGTVEARLKTLEQSVVKLLGLSPAPAAAASAAKPASAAKAAKK
jgi:hypothetical protein